MPREDYEQKKQDRIERYKARAERADANSAAAYQRSRDLLDPIPFGQPILVGHHSERGHRATLRKADTAMRRSSEEASKAKHYREKALDAERNRTISSDDPDAISLLRSKLEGLEARREQIKKANKAIKRKGATPETVAAELDIARHITVTWFKPDFAGRIGFPSYVLSNLGGNIRRIKERIETLEATAGDETTEEMIGDVRLVDNVEENRLQLFFPGKPDEETRRKLKSSGFRWCRSEGAWQAFRGNGATAKAKAILEA
ncbi:MAG: DUF3560 domain-containing protein [Planctomycetota bacterium]|nr:DUF3560 domain-containing protein [Planctomycetota bacterium]